MKLLKKYWLKLICLILIIFIAIYVPCVAIKSARDYEIYKEPQLNTRIYSIYHVETFEGGGKSRSNFLNQIARKLEADYPGNLFILKTIEPSELESALSNQKPDIISFGYGVGKIVLPYLNSQNETYSIREELLNSGMFDNKIYAYPYISSGYAMITHGIMTENLLVGESMHIQPENIYSTLNLTPKKFKNSYEAYKNFIYDKNTNLLGTARDVFRVENLNKIGRLNASITPIVTYTDLTQYIGITNNDILTKKFVSLCLSDEFQKKLIDYSLFSVLNNKIYSSGIYNDMENAIYKCMIARVFQ